MTDVQLRQFLLRRTEADLAARLQDAILTEEGFAERLREAQFDLLDDYAMGRLNAEDAASVERNLLRSVENVNTVRTVRALAQQAEPLRTPTPDATPASDATPAPDATPTSDTTARPPAGQGSRWTTQRISGTAMLMAASLAALVLVPRWLLSPDRPASGAGPAASPGAPPATSPSASARGGEGVVKERAVVTLLADVNRGAERPLIEITSDAASVWLQLEVPEQARNSAYSIQIRDSVGRTLFEKNALRVRSAGPYRFVEAELPSTALAPGDRTVALIPAAGDDATPAFTWHIAAARKPPAPK